MTMQRNRNFLRERLLTRAAVVAGAYILASLGCAQVAQAQFLPGVSSRTTISGSVMIEGDGQPASSIRVNVRSLTGGQVATAYTDAGGAFGENGREAGSYGRPVGERAYHRLAR